MKRVLTSVAVMAISIATAAAADPLIGNWKTQDGTTSVIAHCAGGYCITVKSGKYAGRKIGSFSGKDGNYSGQVTDPASNKTYNGTLKMSGNTVKMSGCVMKVFCQSQTWSRL